MTQPVRRAGALRPVDRIVRNAGAPTSFWQSAFELLARRDTTCLTIRRLPGVIDLELTHELSGNKKETARIPNPPVELSRLFDDSLLGSNLSLMLLSQIPKQTLLSFQTALSQETISLETIKGFDHILIEERAIPGPAAAIPPPLQTPKFSDHPFVKTAIQLLQDRHPGKIFLLSSLREGVKYLELRVTSNKNSRAKGRAISSEEDSPIARSLRENGLVCVYITNFTTREKILKFFNEILPNWGTLDEATKQRYSTDNNLNDQGIAVYSPELFKQLISREEPAEDTSNATRTCSFIEGITTTLGDKTAHPLRFSMLGHYESNGLVRSILFLCFGKFEFSDDQGFYILPEILEDRYAKKLKEKNAIVVFTPGNEELSTEDRTKQLETFFSRLENEELDPLFKEFSCQSERIRVIRLSENEDIAPLAFDDETLKGNPPTAQTIIYSRAFAYFRYLLADQLPHSIIARYPDLIQEPANNLYRNKFSLLLERAREIVSEHKNSPSLSKKLSKEEEQLRRWLQYIFNYREIRKSIYFDPNPEETSYSLYEKDCEMLNGKEIDEMIISFRQAFRILMTRAYNNTPQDRIIH